MEVSYIIEPSSTHHHLYWIDLNGDGILHECAVMRKDAAGNILYFKTNDLDEIDKKRLASILMDRNAGSFELYDLMAQKTLGNGCNALQYFHQLVKQLTPNGKILDPRSGQMGGAVTGQIQTVKPA
jgi:hypothetical protein